MWIDLSALRRKADKSKRQLTASIALANENNRRTQAANDEEDRLRRGRERAELVQRLKAQLKKALDEAASKGERSIVVEKELCDLESHNWSCGKCPTNSLFSHEHSRECLCERVKLKLRILEEWGLKIVIKHDSYPEPYDWHTYMIILARF